MADIQLVMIDDFLIDCSISESHTFESQVTEYPVESGSNITDNVRPMPITIEMECLVSNSPIGTMKTFRDNISTGEDSTKPSVAAYEKLQLIRKRRQPVTIRTSLRTFDKMVLKNLTIPRSGKSGDDLRFTATFQQIETVDNKRSIRVSTPIGNGKKKVSKTPLPNGTQFIMLDTANHEWFDPDYNRWRKYYVDGLGKEMILTKEGDTSIYGPAPEFRLHRGDFTATTSAENTQTNAATAIAAVRIGKFRNIVLVPLNRCVLVGFILTFNPVANEANNNRVFRPR